MLFRLFASICLFTSLLCAWGQTAAVVHGRVVDHLSGVALEGVHIQVEGTKHGTVSDHSGKFSITLAIEGSPLIDLTMIGYAPLRVAVNTNTALADELLIKMERQSVELPVVTIDRPGPEIVYQRNDLHVGDYFANAQGLWVLTYERPQLWHKEAEAGKQVFREARLHLLDTLFVERCSVRLPERVFRLHHDHAYRTIVEGVDQAWSAAVQNGEILLEVVDKGTLNEAILPWTDSINGMLLGSTFSPTFPAFDHIAYQFATNDRRSICAVEDSRLMELFRSQYKYMSGRDKVIAMDLEIETGIEREILAGYMTGFHRDPYFDPPYAPLFVVADTLCVFDHNSGSVKRFTKELAPIDEVPITHQKDRNWCTRLFQDQRTGRVYALYARGVRTWLRSVDPGTGELGAERQLTHRFPEAVQVNDGHVYYVYRPFGSLQHRTLYREALH